MIKSGMVFHEARDKNNLVGYINRECEGTIDTILPCGYRQKFWHELTDLEAVERCKLMKIKGIEPY